MSSILRFPMLKSFNFGSKLNCKAEINGANYRFIDRKAERTSIFNEFECNQIVWNNKIKELEDKLNDEINEKKSFIVFFSVLLSERDAIISNLNDLLGKKDNEFEELKHKMELEKEEIENSLDEKDSKIFEMENRSTEQSQLLDLLEGKLEESMMNVRSLTFHLHNVKHDFQKYIEEVETRDKYTEEVSEIESDEDASEDELEETQSEESQTERIDYGASFNFNPGREIELLKQKISRLHRLNWRLATTALHYQSTSFLSNSDYSGRELSQTFYHDNCYEVNDSQSVPIFYTSQSEFTYPQFDLPDENTIQNTEGLNAFPSPSDFFSSKSLNSYQLQPSEKNQIQLQFQDQVQFWNREQAEAQAQDEVQDQTLYDYQNSVNATQKLNEEDFSVSSPQSNFSNKYLNTDANAKDEFEYNFFKLQSPMTVDNASHSFPSGNRSSSKTGSRFDKLFSQIYDNDSSQMPPMTHFHENNNQESNDSLPSPILLF